MDSFRDISYTPEHAIDRPFRYYELALLSDEGVEIDTRQQVTLAPELEAALCHQIGMLPPVVATISVHEHLFVLMDTRDRESANVPFILVQPGDELRTKGVWPDEPLVIGRNHHVDRFDYSQQVSRDHFAVLFDSATETLMLRDEASRNGTYVSGALRSLEPVGERPEEVFYINSNFTQEIVMDLEQRHGLDAATDNAPYGYYKGYPIIGRRSPSVRGGVQGAIGGEQNIVDDTSPYMQQVVAATLRRLAFEYKPDHLPSPRAVLKTIVDQTALLLDYDIETTEALAEELSRGEQLVPLSSYVEAGVGVCRQQSLLAALLIEAAVDAGYLTGQTWVERNQDLLKQGAHEWTMYRDASGDEYIVDAASKVVLSREEATRRSGWRYLVAPDDE